MFKKIFIYGLAFGSLSAAFLFIHLNNYGPDQSPFQKGMYHLFQMLVLPSTCVFLLLKNLRSEYVLTEDKATPPKPGNLIMASLFSSLIMAGVVSLMYAYIYHYMPHVIEYVKSYDTTLIEARKEKIIESLANRNDTKTYEEVLQNHFNQYLVWSQVRINMFQFSSISLFVAGIMSLYFMRKDKKRATS